MREIAIMLLSQPAPNQTRVTIPLVLVKELGLVGGMKIKVLYDDGTGDIHLRKVTS